MSHLGFLNWLLYIQQSMSEAFNPQLPTVTEKKNSKLQEYSIPVTRGWRKGSSQQKTFLLLSQILMEKSHHLPVVTVGLSKERFFHSSTLGFLTGWCQCFPAEIWVSTSTQCQQDYKGGCKVELVNAAGIRRPCGGGEGFRYLYPPNSNETDWGGTKLG